jgi:hypothetical protein
VVVHARDEMRAMGDGDAAPLAFGERHVGAADADGALPRRRLGEDRMIERSRLSG